MSKEVKRYAERDAYELDKAGNYYCRHVSAMTGEGLHSKSDIAAELGWRDMQIEALLAERDALKKDAERYRWLRSVGQQQLNAAMHYGHQELDRFVDAALQGAQP